MSLSTEAIAAAREFMVKLEFSWPKIEKNIRSYLRMTEGLDREVVSFKSTVAGKEAVVTIEVVYVGK